MERTVTKREESTNLLAMSFAHMGEKTLILDANLRRPPHRHPRGDV